MNGAAIVLAMATLGVDYGWRLDNNGQLEYIIQIPPSQLETLRDSPEGISSSIPPEVVRHVKRFRIVVGTEPLPKDPLPAFTPGQDLGAVTPLRLDTSKVNPAGGEFNDFGGLVSPALESTVTPIEDSAGGPARGALPGPAVEAPSEPAGLNDTLPIPPLPRTDRVRDSLGTMFPEGPLATVQPGSSIRRETNDGSFRPNVSAPGPDDAYGDGRNPSLASVGGSRPPERTLPPSRELSPTWTSPNPYGTGTKDKSHIPLLLTVCALCLSIGGNIYLGWIAWGYYLKYRESFESWRNSWSSPG